MRRNYKRRMESFCGLSSTFANKHSLVRFVVYQVYRLFSQESLTREIQPLLRGTIRAHPREAILQEISRSQGKKHTSVTSA